MKRRILAWALAVCMALRMLPGTARAASSGTCGAEGDGSNLTWTLDDNRVLPLAGGGNGGLY